MGMFWDGRRNPGLLGYLDRGRDAGVQDGTTRMFRQGGAGIQASCLGWSWDGHGHSYRTSCMLMNNITHTKVWLFLGLNGHVSASLDNHLEFTNFLCTRVCAFVLLLLLDLTVCWLAISTFSYS